jgi:hypothetical protein
VARVVDYLRNLKNRWLRMLTARSAASTCFPIAYRISSVIVVNGESPVMPDWRSFLAFSMNSIFKQRIEQGCVPYRFGAQSRRPLTRDHFFGQPRDHEDSSRVRCQTPTVPPLLEFLISVAKRQQILMSVEVKVNRSLRTVSRKRHSNLTPVSLFPQYLSDGVVAVANEASARLLVCCDDMSAHTHGKHNHQNDCYEHRKEFCAHLEHQKRWSGNARLLLARSFRRLSVGHYRVSFGDITPRPLDRVG